VTTQAYAAYLDSDQWQQIRKRVMGRAQWLCICGGKATDVHHVSYDQLVLDGKDDRALVALCRECHDRVHFDGDGERVTIAEAKKRLKRMRRKAPKAPKTPKLRRKAKRYRRYSTDAGECLTRIPGGDRLTDAEATATGQAIRALLHTRRQ